MTFPKKDFSWDASFVNRGDFFSPFSVVVEEFSHFKDWPSLQSYNRERKTGLPSTSLDDGLRPHFVLQEENLSPDEFEKKTQDFFQVPCRLANWHDFMNMMVWRVFPKIKRRLNTLHCAQEKDTHGESDFRLQKRAWTHFDESGILILSQDDSLLELVRRFQWHELFWSRRKEVIERMAFLIVGHGVYEKCLWPFLGLTAHGILISVEPSFFESNLQDQICFADEIASQFIEGPSAPKRPMDLSPVPILGVPGWYPQNDHETFYHNESYFRPGRNTSRKN